VSNNLDHRPPHRLHVVPGVLNARPMDVGRSHVNSEYLKRILRRVGFALILILVFVDSSFAQDTGRQQPGGPPATTAQATQASTTTVSCASKLGEPREGPADTSEGIALARSYGEAACLLGKTWGYDDRGVWVSDGCVADFIVSGTSAAGPPP